MWSIYCHSNYMQCHFAAFRNNFIKMFFDSAFWSRMHRHVKEAWGRRFKYNCYVKRLINRCEEHRKISKSKSEDIKWLSTRDTVLWLYDKEKGMFIVFMPFMYLDNDSYLFFLFPSISYICFDVKLCQRRVMDWTVTNYFFSIYY